MMQILDSEKEQKIVPVFRLAFRPFFLGASVFSVVAMVLWAMFWAGNGSVAAFMYGNPIWWHSHEMLFGFTGAVIIGFLLTAVQNWTGNPGVRGWALAFVFALWLLARLGLLFGTPNMVWMVVDLLWMPISAYFLAKPIIIRRQWNNLFFTPMIVLMTLLNALFHLIALGMVDLTTRSVAFATVMVISLIVLVVGGRVIPFFTWRGTQTEQITRVTWIEIASLASSWLLLLVVLASLALPSTVIQQVLLPVLLLSTAVLHFIRFARWRTFSTLRVPLLWSLHFAYAAMIVGMVLLAVHYTNQAVSYSVALHMLTVGGIGCMVIAMIARVSLGHTGRALQIKRVMVVAFIALIASTLVRTVMIVWLPALTINAYVISACLWAVAFSIFSVVYYPMLTQARVDGRPG